VPTIRTRVISARWSPASSAASSGERRRPFRGAAPRGRGRLLERANRVLVALTDHACARNVVAQPELSVGFVSASNARACPIVSRPPRRSAWIPLVVAARRSEFAIELRSRRCARQAPPASSRTGEELFVGLASSIDSGLREQVLDERKLEAFASVASRNDRRDALESGLSSARQRRSPAMS